jgi:hypothetical protein
MLQFVLHNWDDESCRRILRNCRRVMSGADRLLIIESQMPDLPMPSDPVVGADIMMFVLNAGAERSTLEYKHLLTQEGFELRAVTPIAAPVHLLEAV